MDLEALVTDELREDDRRATRSSRSRSRPPRGARRTRGSSVDAARGRLASTGSVHRRRPDRRGLPGDQRRHRRSPRSSASSRSARSPRARTRSARSRSCSRSTASTGAGQGVSTDIIDAAARAYVRALSVAVARSRAGEAIGLPETAPERPCGSPGGDCTPERRTRSLTVQRSRVEPRRTSSPRLPASDCMNSLGGGRVGVVPHAVRPDSSPPGRGSCAHGDFRVARRPPLASVSGPSARGREPRGIAIQRWHCASSSHGGRLCVPRLRASCAPRTPRSPRRAAARPSSCSGAERPSPLAGLSVITYTVR